MYNCSGKNTRFPKSIVKIHSLLQFQSYCRRSTVGYVAHSCFFIVLHLVLFNSRTSRHQVHFLHFSTTFLSSRSAPYNFSFSFVSAHLFSGRSGHSLLLWRLPQRGHVPGVAHVKCEWPLIKQFTHKPFFKTVYHFSCSPIRRNVVQWYKRCGPNGQIGQIFELPIGGCV